MCVALDVVQNDLSISYDFTDGTHFHMHASAVGKAILAQVLRRSRNRDTRQIRDARTHGKHDYGP